MTRSAVGAWSAATLTLGCMLADSVVIAQMAPLFTLEALVEYTWPAVPAGALGSSMMGALIVGRYARHPIGWLLVAGGSLTSFAVLAGDYAVWVANFDGAGTESLAQLAVWLNQLLNAPVTLATVTVIFLLAPDGTLLSPRWRYVVVLSMLGVALSLAAILILEPSDIAIGGRDRDYGVSQQLATLGFVAIAAGLLGAVASLVIRLHRSRGAERQQLRWMAAAAAAFAVAAAFVVAANADVAEDVSNDVYLAPVPLYLAYFAFPLCTAVAVLRYRLFELELIVNRALVLALMTGVVAVAYVLVVTVTGAALGRNLGSSLLATAAVALGFQPLRSSVVRLADRLVYGRSAAPYEELARFTRLLSVSPRPATLLHDVAEAAGHAVSAEAVDVTLDVPGGSTRVARWTRTGADPPTTSELTDIEVVDRSERLGVIRVHVAPGRPLRLRDRDLLQDLAQETAIAFRNARLTAELSDDVVQLQHHALHLIESRRRLITTEEAECRRLERAMQREVMPHLGRLPNQIDRLMSSPPNGGLHVQAAIGSATLALEGLRTITRGVFPAQLARAGLVPALSSDHGRLPDIALRADSSVVGRRYAEPVETAAYFAVAEAVRELVPPLEVEICDIDDRLRISVTGGLASEALPLGAVRDRVEAAEGTLATELSTGGARVLVQLPARRSGGTSYG